MSSTYYEIHPDDTVEQARAELADMLVGKCLIALEDTGPDTQELRFTGGTLGTENYADGCCTAAEIDMQDLVPGTVLSVEIDPDIEASGDGSYLIAGYLALGQDRKVLLELTVHVDGGRCGKDRSIGITEARG